MGTTLRKIAIITKFMVAIIISVFTLIFIASYFYQLGYHKSVHELLQWSEQLNSAPNVPGDEPNDNNNSDGTASY